MSSAPGRIRRYEPGDLPRVLDVWEAASRVGHPFLSEAFLEVERERIPRVYLPLAETWVFERDEVVLGFISLLGQEVGALFVDPRSHRRGVGRALMEMAQELHAELEVEVFEKNVLGRAFYERCGFAESTRGTHPETGLEVVRLKYATAPRVEGSEPESR